MCLLKILYGLLYSLGHVLTKMLLQDRYGRALRLNLIGTVKDMNIGHTKFLSYRLQGRIGKEFFVIHAFNAFVIFLQELENSGSSLRVFNVTEFMRKLANRS